ncbi:lactate dehydrogenase [Nanchangia anserum]|uniref:Lactate dehydrogenase n=1 Tax=Nanchangia anserum TaxID=2692125 RepID=A0A8I0KQV3_9ACTO|nr:NAD(P)-dependent oxidoreductase [Nanchangia anserum]MBD3688822.1 lactate dehydrogenase [Nanchangia anserum]QOX81099.1 lactate dehydrogenase [Nanchangia anserum]
MRIIVGDVDPDEVPFFDQWRADNPGVTLELHAGHLSVEDLRCGGDFAGVCVLGTPMTREMMTEMVAHGARYISNRSIGYDNIDFAAARDLGIRVAHVQYSPGSVAEFTLMLMLMTLRKVRQMRERFAAQDFVPAGLDGRELASLTVGILGAGRIGGRVAQLLSSFGCTVLAHDPVQRPELDGIVTYVDAEELFRRSDVVTIHALLDDSTYHLVDAEALAALPEGAIVVNAARGAIIDTPALVDALESGRLAGAALDVVEGEVDYYFADCRGRAIADPLFARLRALPTVILTQHLAYLTREVVEEMVRDGLDHMREFVTTGRCDDEVSSD